MWTTDVGPSTPCSPDRCTAPTLRPRVGAVRSRSVRRRRGFGVCPAGQRGTDPQALFALELLSRTAERAAARELHSRGDETLHNGIREPARRRLLVIGGDLAARTGWMLPNEASAASATRTKAPNHASRIGSPSESRCASSSYSVPRCSSASTENSTSRGRSRHPADSLY